MFTIKLPQYKFAYNSISKCLGIYTHLCMHMIGKYLCIFICTYNQFSVIFAIIWIYLIYIYIHYLSIQGKCFFLLVNKYGFMERYIERKIIVFLMRKIEGYSFIDSFQNWQNLLMRIHWITRCMVWHDWRFA